MSRYAAVILAAGQGTRFRAAGGREPSKLVATLGDAPLVRHVAAAALGARARPVIMVTGHASEAVAHAVLGLPIIHVHNQNHAAGLAGSLRAGIHAVPQECEGAVVLLADMPGVRSTTIDALVACAAEQPLAHAVVPVVEGRRGNPVLLARALFPAVALLTGDAGARHLLHDPALRIEEVAVTDPGTLHDVDLPEQLGSS